MSRPPSAPLKVRRATALDRSALREWVQPFALLVRLEAHATWPAAHVVSHAATSQFVVLCDALRVAFAESSASQPKAADLRVFLKPSAWARVTRQQVIDAVLAHLATQPAAVAPPVVQAR